MPTVQKDPTLAQIHQANHKAIAHLKNMRTLEPKAGTPAWVTSAPANMHQVITKRQDGRDFSGSFDRYVQRNKISAPEARYLEAVFKFAAGRQMEGGGIQILKASDAELSHVEKELNKLADTRDLNKNKKLDLREKTSFGSIKTGKATLEALTKILARKTTGLDTEIQFSKLVTKTIDLMYSKGDLTPANIEAASRGKSRKQQDAIRAGYHAVSRHMSRGRTAEMPWICRDQRREVTRILLNLFAGDSDTRKAISALK